MNTIKIYFDTDGSIKELKKDFQLYQGQFHDKLLNVYVPTSVLAPDFTVENEQEQTIADFVASTSVKVGMKYIARNGSIKKSKNYYMNYLKVMTQNGVEYAVYERKLPKEFTTYVGQGQTAPVLVVNVVNMDVESNPAEVLSVVTTQECFLDVMPSADLDNDEAVEPTEWELMNAELNAVKETLLEKQDKEDILLQTDAKTVVGAINENKANIDTNETAIGENSTDIAELRNDVMDLQALLATGETPIGKMEGDELPTDEQLNAFVQSVVIREQRVGDVVIFVLDNTTTYKYTYTEDGWQSYEITTVDKASNSTYGTVEGTYTAEEQSAKVRNILADINNGKVENLYVKDGDNYRNLKEFLGANKTAIAEIIDGTTPVAEAIKAEQDGEGNNIVNTYLTQTAGATKQYVQDYAVPKTFTNVYFISADGYVGEPPAVSETPAFSATTTGVGETEIIKDGDSSDLSMDLTADFDLSISNSYRNTFWVVASEDCNVQFRLVTQYKKPTEEWTDLNIELSEEYPLVAENYERIDFSSQFLSLGSETVSLGLGDKIRQFLSVIVQVDTPITFGVFSNTVYPSTFNLIAQNYVPAGATSVYVNGSPVSTWNANTKADADNVYTKTEADSQFLPKTNPMVTGDITISGTVQSAGLTDGNNTDYKAVLPNTTSWTANKTLAMSDQLPNSNLLINGDFRINQRGSSSYSTTNKYTVDRWAMEGYARTLTPVDTGLQISSASEGNNSYIVQKIEDTSYLWGKTLSISAKFSDGTFLFNTFTLPQEAPSSDTSYGATSSGGMGLKLYYYTSSQTLGFTIDCNNTSQVVINYAKLEFGNVATPFVPRLYGEELALCQRYYQRDTANSNVYLYGIGSNPNNNVVYIGYKFVHEMRITPTFTANGTFRLVEYENSVTSITSSQITQQSVASNTKGARLNIAGSFSSSSIYFFSGDNTLSYLEFDAEIY